MKKETDTGLLTQLKSDLISTFILFIFLIIITKIVLYKESIITLSLTLLRFFYSVMIPGLFISLYLHTKLSYSARLIFGSVFTIALVSITSYYFGLLGLHVKYHPFVIPPLIMLAGILVYLKNQD